MLLVEFPSKYDEDPLLTFLTVTKRAPYKFIDQSWGRAVAVDGSLVMVCQLPRGLSLLNGYQRLKRAGFIVVKNITIGPEEVRRTRVD